MIGVTGLPLDTVSRWKRWLPENDTTPRTTVLDRTEDGRLCVCNRGQVSYIEEDVQEWPFYELLLILPRNQRLVKFSLT